MDSVAPWNLMSCPHKLLRDDRSALYSVESTHAQIRLLLLLATGDRNIRRQGEIVAADRDSAYAFRARAEDRSDARIGRARGADVRRVARIGIRFFARWDSWWVPRHLGESRRADRGRYRDPDFVRKPGELSPGRASAASAARGHGINCRSSLPCRSAMADRSNPTNFVVGQVGRFRHNTPLEFPL